MCHLTDNEQDFLPGCDLCGRPEGDCGDGGEENVAEVGGQGLERQEEQGEEVPRLQRRLLHDRDNVTSKDSHKLVICAVRKDVRTRYQAMIKHVAREGGGVSTG